MAAASLHIETFQVRFYECEPAGQAAAAALCRFAQEAADAHCRTFGMSLLEVRALNQMWVVTRFRLQMERYPHIGEAVTVETWASARTNGLRAHREFLFLDSSGGVLGRADSIWLLLDLSRKRPVRLPQVILDICNPERTDAGEFEIPRLPRPACPSSAKVFEVGWKDLDSNQHANNVNYIEWALEALPMEIRRDQMLVQLDVEFLGQAFYGDKLTSTVEMADRASMHQLSNAAGTLLSLVVARFG